MNATLAPLVAAALARAAGSGTFLRAALIGPVI
jgi:hypothetical protein